MFRHFNNNNLKVYWQYRTFQLIIFYSDTQRVRLCSSSGLRLCLYLVFILSITVFTFDLLVIVSRPRLPYRLHSSVRGSRPLSIDSPSDSVSHHTPYLVLIALSHLHLIYTRKYKQHTYTHPLRSLDLPRLSPLSVFLSIVCFLVITPASFLDPVILCWFPRLGLFLSGLWYLLPALTTLPVSLTTYLLCPLCSHCWWLTRSCLTILNKAANGSRSVWCPSDVIA